MKSERLQVTNPNYDLVIDRLHLYYNMQWLLLALIMTEILLFNSWYLFNHIQQP